MVGTDAAYAPFESQNEKGEIVGLTIDIVQRRCREGRHRGQVRQHAVGRHLQRAAAGRPRHAGVVDHDHRRAQADDGLHEPVLRRLPADRREGELEGQQVRRPEEAQGRRADRHHRRRGRHQAAGQEQHQHQALRVDAAGAEGTRGRRRRRRRRRQRRGRQLRDQQRRREVQDRQRQGLRARAVRLRGQEGQHRVAREAQQGPRGHQGRRQLRPIFAKYFGAARLPRPRPRPRSKTGGPADGSALGDPCRLRAAVPRRPVDDDPADDRLDRRRAAARRAARPRQQFARRPRAEVASCWTGACGWRAASPSPT